MNKHITTILTKRLSAAAGPGTKMDKIVLLENGTEPPGVRRLHKAQAHVNDVWEHESSVLSMSCSLIGKFGAYF